MKRWLNVSVDCIYVRFVLELWRDASMHAKVVAIYIRGYWHGFKCFDEFLINLLIFEFVQDLLSESEMLCHCS